LGRKNFVKIRCTSTARTQFISALAYILQDNPEAARRFRQTAEAAAASFLGKRMVIFLELQLLD
jgi:plasmid stabilization system protein ParE